jgi:alpha-galactosidase
MAVLCRAMIKHSGIQNVIGVCHGVQEGIMDVADLLGLDAHELDVIWIGTNHYHWFTRIRHKGVDVYPEVRRRLAERRDLKGRRMTQRLSEAYGYQIVYPPDDHALEFYPFFGRLPGASSAPYGYGEELAERYAALEEMALAPSPVDESGSEKAAQREAQLGEFEERLSRVVLPEAPSDQLTGEGLGSLIEAISLGRRQVQIVNIPNRGAVPNLPDEAVLELEAVTDSCGVRGIYTGEAPLSLKGILEKRIAWQELVVEAGVKGDRNLALQALLLDEMAILPEQAEDMLSALLAASKDALPQFV